MIGESACIAGFDFLGQAWAYFLIHFSKEFEVCADWKVEKLHFISWRPLRSQVSDMLPTVIGSFVAHDSRNFTAIQAALAVVEEEKQKEEEGEEDSKVHKKLPNWGAWL